MIKEVWRDTNGVVINIGPWDYRVEIDESEVEFVTNPIPAGATSAEEVVVIGWDGGLYAADDPRQSLIRSLHGS